MSHHISPRTEARRPGLRSMIRFDFPRGPRPARLRSYARHSQSALMSTRLRIHDPTSLDSAVLILGLPRSGTTWLMELLTTDIDVVPVYEPLRPTTDRRMPRVGSLGGFLAATDFATTSGLSEYLEAYMTGRRISRWSARSVPLRFHASASRRVVKLIRANCAASWIARRYSSTPIVSVVRHPCAFVSSISTSPGDWQSWTAQELASLLSPDTIGRLGGLGSSPSRHRVLAAWWAQQAGCLSDAAEGPSRLFVHYEDLVASDLNVLRQVFSTAGLDAPADLARRSRRRSSTSYLSHEIPQSDLAASWRSRLSEAESAEILRIASEAGGPTDRYE